MDHDQHIRDQAIALINAQSTMALATAKSGHTWVAPVYYVFYNSKFYFFSSPDSRHITEALDSEQTQASSAIYPDSNTWQEIKGIQMSGYIRSAGKGLRAIQAVRAYISKFPFTKEFFKTEALDLESFRKRFRVSLYCFEPTLIFYLDNQIQFGFREEIALG